MGLGSTAKKIQRVADMAEDVYRRLNELREQVVEMRETVEETERRTDRIEAELAEQRELLNALAVDAGLDADDVAARAPGDEAEGPPLDPDPEPDAEGSADDGSTDGGSTDEGAADGTAGTDEGTTARTADE